jgi:hypothetical protein
MVIVAALKILQDLAVICVPQEDLEKIVIQSALKDA